jgi:hypothetical protein
MQKIVDIKILQVTFRYGGAGSGREHSDLTIPLRNIETQIKEYLAKGWQMKGEINYVSFSHDSCYITQTMVKYETPTLENDLFSQ